MSVNRENYAMTVQTLLARGCTNPNGYSLGDVELQNNVKLLTNTDITFIIKHKNYDDTILIVNTSEDEDYESNNELYNNRIKDTLKQLEILRDDYNVVAIVTSGYKNFNVKTFIQPKESDYSEVNYSGILSDLSIYFKIFLDNADVLVDNLNQEAKKDKEKNIKGFIEGIKNILWGPYNAKNYGYVILPFFLLRRLDCTLESTQQSVMERYKNIKTYNNDDIYDELTEITESPYYNISGLSFKELVKDPDGIYENMTAYIDGFSDNIKTILNYFELDPIIVKLYESDILYSVVQSFKNLDLSIDTIDTHDMGLIYEELIQNLSEGDTDSGEYFTCRDMVELCAELLVKGDNVERKTIDIYDMAMGTSQMLTTTKKILNKKDSSIEVDIFGQEINFKTFAIAQSDALMCGVNPENMRQGNTLTNDRFKEDEDKEYKFDYVISNPPYGVNWKHYKDIIESNISSGIDSRFNIGLPSVSDGQLLFTVNGVKKLHDNGRMVIIHNGSPLFGGAAGGGEAAIRKWLVDNDYIEAIVKIAPDMFKNTPIVTYLWVINKAKEGRRKGFIQLIDATNCASKMRKSDKSKRNELSDADREVIIKAYLDFKEEEYESNGKTCESKIITNESLAVKDDAGKQKYEIPFDKLFYKAEEHENSDAIKHRILKLNSKIQLGITNLFGENTDKGKEA